MAINCLVRVWSFLFSMTVVLSSGFDVNDILSAPLMPMSWLMLDNHSKEAEDNINSTNASTNMPDTKHDGSFDIAYSTMGFHRYSIYLIDIESTNNMYMFQKNDQGIHVQ